MLCSSNTATTRRWVVTYKYMQRPLYMRPIQQLLSPAAPTSPSLPLSFLRLLYTPCTTLNHGHGVWLTSLQELQS